MTKTTYTIRREGQFYANLEPCDQCGGGAGQKTFTFDASITVDELDEHGFVADNRDIPKAFNHWEEGRWYGSCEDLAAGGLYHLFALVRDRASAIRVRITANGDSSMEVNWQRGQTGPQRRPRRVTVESQERIDRRAEVLL